MYSFRTKTCGGEQRWRSEQVRLMPRDGACSYLEFLFELLEDLGDSGEVEGDVVLQHEQLEVQLYKRPLARCAQVTPRAACLYRLHVLMQLVKDDHALFDSLHVKVVHGLDLVID
jgi:hypothetical protein